MIAIGEYTISALNDLDYYEVTSSNSMVVIEDENFTPEAVTFTSKHRLGNGNLEAYSGRFKIETSKDGEAWETKYTSSGNESTVEYELPSALEDKVPYLFRKSVGGDRAIEEIVGGSVVWNQLINHTTKTDRGITSTYDSTTHIYTLSGTSTGTYAESFGAISTDNTHTYLTIGRILSNPNNVSIISGQLANIGSYIRSGIYTIFKPANTKSAFHGITGFASGTDLSGIQMTYVAFDLTTMFGTQITDYIYSLEQQTAGSGIAKLRSWGFFTKDYYPYCLPTIRSVSGLVEKRYVGFNQWDEEWEVGTINTTTGANQSYTSYFRSKNYTQILPSTKYYVKSSGHGLYVFEYDSDHNYLRNIPGQVDNVYTTSSDASYIRFVNISTNTYNPTTFPICINISNPTKNGTYEPYEVNTYSLDSSLELRGMFKLDSNNNLYADGDVYPSDGNGSRRYNTITYDGSSDETWNYSANYHCFISGNVNDIATGYTPENYINTLGTVPVKRSSNGTKTLQFGTSGTPIENIASSVDVWRTYLSEHPITVLYPLAEPTTFTALPYHNPQELSEYGTEEFVTTGIVPVGHNTKYPANIKNIRCSLYRPNETPSATTLLDQITVPIVSGLQYQPFVQRTVFEWALSSSSTELDENTTWAEQKPKPTQAQPYLWERSRNDYSNGTHTYSDAHCDVTISGVISDVDNVKGQITNKVWKSDITTSINSYDNTTVSTIRDRVSTTEQNLTGITTRVGAVESTTGSLGTRMTAAESSISQNADNIELKVSKDGVISSINQSPESITISADKVNIAGSTAFTSLNSQVTAIQNETNQKSELIRGTQTAATYSWTGTSSTISQLTDGMEIRYWLPFSVGGGTVSGSYSYYDGSKTTTGTNTGVGLTLTLKDGTMTEEIPVYYGSMTRLTSHYGYGNIIRMIYRENVRVNNGNSTYYTVAKGFWCDANYDTNSNYVQYSTAVTSGATNSVYQYSLIMRDTANTWVSIATTNGTGTSKSAYTGGLYYDKVLYHSSGSNYASNKTTSTVYDSIGFDLRYSTNCGTTLTTRKPVYLVGTINNTDKRFYLDTTQWYTQTVPTSADGKTYIYIGEAYSSYQVWLATENKAYQYYNGRFITLEEIKDLEAMTWINSTGQNAADIIANWATDATSATTTINGGLIQTHTIQSSHLATNAIMSNNYQASQNAGSPYSVTGSFLDLDNGNFYTPNFGLDNVNGNAYFNGEITATSGQIGDDTSNHWQIGTVVDFNGNQSAAIESNGTSYIQSGDWMISNNRIDTRHYDNQRKYTYLYEDGVYWDFGLHTPSLTSDNDYDNNFIYIRNHESTIPTLEGAWNYVFRVDRNGMIYINGVSLDDKYASIDGVSGAYLPMSGGSLSGNLSVGGNLTVTGTVSGLKNLSINGKTYNGSSAVTVGTIGAAYGGTGQTSLINSANALINALDTGSSTPVDNDYYISQYVNGGTTTKTYHRRPMSALWLYIKGKINADTDLYTDKFVPKTGGEFTGAVTVSDALIADEITSGNLIVNGVGRFTNGIYGDLTGNASTATVAAKVADSGNGQATTFGYSKTGLSTTSDIAVWDGYELRKITPANLKTSLSLAKGDVGLGNVENKSSATIRGELTSSNVTTALGYTPYNGATNPNGYVSSSGVTSITLKAGTGISLDVDNTAITSTGTRTITNTGVRSISEGTTNGTISVNTGGTTADVVVHGLQALAYKASLGASDVGLGNVTNNKQVKGLSSGTTSGHLVTWGSDGYTVADSGIAKGSVTTKITLSGSDYSASSNTITITKANLQSAVQDTSLVLMTAAERSKLSSIQVSEGGTIDFSGVTASAPITATVNETTKAVNITHNTSGVTQGTYRSVTVNTYGHVTAGTNPTTLSGYGITDAKIASGVITLGSNTITPLTASSTLDATKLSGTASINTTGNATTATKFSSNRSIALTGDVTGSASSNGENGWSIATTVGDDSHGHTPDTLYIPSDFGKTGGLDLISGSKVGSYMSNKSFAIPPEAITIEYSTDNGSTWKDYGATDSHKKGLFSETRYGCHTHLGKATTKEANSVNNQLRITISRINLGRYCAVNSFYTWMTTNGNTVYCKLEHSTNSNPTSFQTIFTDFKLAGWSGHNIKYFSEKYLGGSNNDQTYAFRLTVWQTAINTDYSSADLYDIRFFGRSTHSYDAPYYKLQTNELYTWDNNLNAIFPAKITATSFEGVTWNSIADKPINLKSYSGSLATGGWATLNGKSNSPSIAIAYNNNNASWNSEKYSSSMVFGCNDVRGLLDLAYNQPIVTFGGSSYSGATDDNPKWYFKLKGTSEQIYTFPSTSKTLAATDGSNASGTWGISISGNANTATTASTATKATQDGSGNTITSYYVTLSTTQTISGAKTFSSAVTFANGTWNLMGDDAYIGDCNAAGKLGIKGKNGATGVRFVPYSGSTNNDITIDGTGNLTATGNLIQQGTVTVGSHAKLTYNESLECLEFSFV